MAQFLKAKFLSEALKWKANPRHATDQFFGGLRYDPFIFQQARLTFPTYNQRFPAPANKEFTENFARDLTNPTRNQALLKIISPETLTPEMEAANSQFEALARMEQQTIAQTGGQPVGQSFSLTTQPAPAIPRMTVPPIIIPPTTISPEAVKPEETTTAAATQAATVPEAPPAAKPQPKISQPPLQTPRIPSTFTNTARSLGSNAGVFFQKNVGKFLTGDRVMNFLGKAGNMGINALSGVTNFGGGRGGVFSSLRGIGRDGGGDIFGRIGRFGRGGNMSSLTKIGKNRGKWVFISILLGMMLLTGILAITGTNQTGTIPTGTPTGFDISSCKFTRAGNSQPIKSSTLAGWISSAAVSAGVPPAILASVTMHENPDFTINADNNHDAIKNNYYYFVNSEGNTRAIGLSQISTGKTVIEDVNGNPITVDHCLALLADGGAFKKAASNLGKKIMTPDYYCMDNVNERVQRFCQTDQVVLNSAIYAPLDNKFDDNYLNLCRITDNLTVGAAMLSGKSGTGSWTNSTDAQAAIQGYYGGCSYPGGNYCTEAWNDYQSCQTQSSTGSLIPPSGDLRQTIGSRFHIVFDPSFDQKHLLWAWQILATSETSAPQFLPLLRQRYFEINVGTTDGVGMRTDNTILFSTRPGSFFSASGEIEFKQMFIHELGHVIHGVRGDVTYTNQIENAIQGDRGFLTGYAQGATAADMVCATSDSGERSVQLDEDFAESVSYYINKDTTELNYSNNCPPKSSQNPFSTGRYPNHLTFIKQVLGGNNF